MQKSIGAALCLWLAASLSGVAAQEADPHRVVVPLSEPSRPMALLASLISGGIEVRSHDQREVVVIARDRSETSRQPVRRDGMMRIPNRSLGMTVEEKDNVVRVSVDSHNRQIDLEILVPHEASMRLSCTNNGDILVRDVRGELELNNTNGSITALGIEGSVVANTTNGDVKVTFDGIEAGKAMSFVSFNGDVDVTFQPDFRGKLRMNSAQGEVLTDFEVKLEPRSPIVDRDDRKGHYRVRIEEATRGTVGGGGPEFHFKTYNGDIFIRKAR